MEKILDISKINQLSKYLHKHNKKIVLVGGCFDLLHFGHIKLITEAKKQGDVLIVLMESDKRIKKLKGEGRPLHKQAQRAEMLKQLRDVDYVIVLPDELTNSDYDELVKKLQPAIIATTKGSKALKFITKQAKENNSKILALEPIPNLSTSRILETISKEL